MQTKPIDDIAPSVLIIEDDQAVLDASCMFLEFYGFRVLTAVDCSQALARLALEGGGPDLIIADYRLPGGGTGIETIRCVRDSLGRETPAIIITGDTSPDLLQKINGYGFKVLHKPVDGGEFLALIRQSLGMAG